MNTVHPPPPISFTHTHTHTRTFTHTGSQGVADDVWEYTEVECVQRVEESGDGNTGRAAGAYSSNVRKAFCMSSRSCAYSALILASPSFTGSLNFMELIL